MIKEPIEIEEPIENESEKPKATPKPHAKMIPVKEIMHQGKASLVEWLDEDGRVTRGSVPTVAIQENSVSMETLSKATLYGLDFSALPLPEIDVMELEKELHNLGLWTADDILTKRVELLKALDAIKLAYLRSLIQFAKKIKSGGK